MTGQLLGTSAGQTVTVTLDPPDLRNGSIVTPPITKTAETDANGNYSVEVTPTQGQIGAWTVSSAYAGDDAHDGSQSSDCTVQVTSPVIG